MTMRMTPIVCLLAPLLSACGGGSDEAPLTAPDYRLTVSLPAAGTLCINLNQNDGCEANEPAVSGEAGAHSLTRRHPDLLTTPLLFIPADPAALPLAHPAARQDNQHLTPSPLSTLLQTRISDGLPPAQALTDVLFALAPLHPGPDLAALAQLGDFNRALAELALAAFDDEATLPASERRQQIWQGLVTLQIGRAHV